MKAAPLFVLLLFGTVMPLHAEKITKVHEDGTLSTESGKRVRLVGLEIPVESIPVVSILIASKEVDIEHDKKMADSVYLYVDAHELDFPLKKITPRGSRLLINQFLLEIGAAKLQSSIDPNAFHKASDFRKAEALARERGEGIWSYATTKAAV